MSRQKKSRKLLKGAIVVLFIASITIVAISVMSNDDKKSKAASSSVSNGVMMQAFEWGTTNKGTHWTTLASQAPSLSQAGITAFWLPPAYKGDAGTNDVGYGVYDLYDLGEFNQKGTTRTKYGTKAQYTSLISTLHKNNIQAYADIVLNHKGGADSTQTVSAYKVYDNSRSYNQSGAYDISAWCVFTFPGRNGKYSTFTWDASCFDGVDWDDKGKTKGVFRFANKGWDWQVDGENGNYDYLMYADIDFDNTAVVNELKSWGKWYVNTANLDGFRLDAVKHIKFSFYSDWLSSVRSSTGKDLFSVGEYWTQDLSRLNTYLSATGGKTSLFDVPLHYNFQTAANSSGNYDMRNLFNNTLVKQSPTLAVTFVDNHDSQPGQSLESTVAGWFKPLAYTAILTRESGYPCVFYGDYYGTSDGKISSYKNVINKILLARKNYAYGTQHDYLDNANIIGWTREGDSSHSHSGLAALITDGAGGSKSMYVGTKHAGEVWYDITGNISSKVTIGSNGYATFSVNGGSHSIWVYQSSSSSSGGGTAVTQAPSGNNSVTVYYYNSKNWSNVYIHYCPKNGSWTTAPGVKMTSAGSGYYYYKINLGSATGATVCFNNGSGTWDSNNGSNYSVGTGSATIQNNKVTNQAPTLTSSSSSTTTTTSNKVTVYYYNRNSWKNVYIHYCPSGGKWTTVPGSKMSLYSGKYYKITLDLGSAKQATVCFNNGSGSWDSKNGANYTVGTGDYKVVNGSVSAGKP
ncbi:MAG: alpha-amylase [Lachnospiraceae bacterium]|nr:alpha-amylase [Lachnospiraceae bacterium]